MIDQARLQRNLAFIRDSLRNHGLTDDQIDRLCQDVTDIGGFDATKSDVPNGTVQIPLKFSEFIEPTAFFVWAKDDGSSHPAPQKRKAKVEPPFVKTTTLEELARAQTEGTDLDVEALKSGLRPATASKQSLEQEHDPKAPVRVPDEKSSQSIESAVKDKEDGDKSFENTFGRPPEEDDTQR